MERLVNIAFYCDTAIDIAAILVCVHDADWSLLLVARLRIFLPFFLFGAFPINHVFIERNLAAVAVLNTPSDLLVVFVAVRITTLTGYEASSLSL